MLVFYICPNFYGEMALVMFCEKMLIYFTANISQNKHWIYFPPRSPQILFHHETLGICKTLAYVSRPLFSDFFWSVFIFLFKFSNQAGACELGSQSEFLIFSLFFSYSLYPVFSQTILLMVLACAKPLRHHPPILL